MKLVIPYLERGKGHEIRADYRQMGSMPCIWGLRIPVATVVDMLAEGMSTAEILHKPEDIRGSLHYAAEAVREQIQ